MSIEYRSIRTQRELLALVKRLRRGRPNVDPLLAVFTYARALHLRGVAIEDDYVDRDYRDEFSNVYGKCFRSYPDRCTRVHFFSRPVASRNDLESNSDDYIGYCVVRPVEVGIVGRTLLRPLEDPDRAYYLTVQQSEVHVEGVRLSITGAPFIEQDGMAITCAQSSMWMALRYLSSILPMPMAGPYEISRVSAAESPFEQRVIPSGGLRLGSMVQGFKNLGLGTLFETMPSLPSETPSSEKAGTKAGEREALWDLGWDPVARIYSSVESTMPVIALLRKGGRFAHTVTVVGHLHLAEVESLAQTLARRRPSTLGKKIVASHHWTDAFIVHDDQTGPYRILPVDQHARDSLGGTRYGPLLTPEDYPHVEASVTGLISPLPEKVYLTGDAAEELATVYLTQETVRRELLRAGFVHHVEGALDLLESMDSEDDPVVLRTYFIRSEQFKKELQQPPLRGNDADGEMVPAVRAAFLETPMPTYVWLVEITTRQLFSVPRERDRRDLGEMVLDATSNKSDPYPFLVCHLPGVLLTFDRVSSAFAWEAKPRRKHVPDDHPYRHHTRQLRTRLARAE